MYNFNSIRINADTLAYNLASAYVNSKEDSDHVAVSALIEMLNQIVVACHAEDIVAVKQLWSSFVIAYYGFNPGAYQPSI